MPDTVESLYEEADRLYYDGSLDEAADVYKRILKIDPDYQPAVHSLGIIHYDQDEPGQVALRHGPYGRAKKGEKDRPGLDAGFPQEPHRLAYGRRGNR